MEIEKLWKEVTGKTMSPEVSSRILKIQKALNIRDDDGLWEIILALEFYQNLYEVWPSSVRAETEVVAKQLKEASVAVATATSAEVKASRELAAREIVKMQEEAKANIANALGGTLENEIRNAVGRIQSQSNRPLHRKWLIAMAVGLPIAVALGGWGLWSFYTYAKNVGAADTAAYANPVSKSFYHLMECDEPGWKTKWSADGKELWCYPHADKDGNQYGWRIR
jgi:hypothetical protein